MNETAIKLLIFSAGVGIGALASKTYFERKYKAIADEEIESCKTVFKRYAEKAMENLEEKDPEPVVYSTTAPATVSYNDYHDKEKEFDKEQEVAKDMRTLYPKDEEDAPYEISIEEYEEDTSYSKVTLNYFVDDGALIYEESEKPAYDDTTIGIQNLDDFAYADERSAYFRNPAEGVDYEVIKVDGSYKELIAGDV